MPDECKLAEQLKALGDPLRLKIIRHLPTTSDCKHGNNVCQLAQKLGIPQPTISHHLKVLRQASLIENKKMCRDVFYWVNQPEIERILHCINDTLKR